MKVWAHDKTDAGLHTALVGPATVPELTAALDPSAAHVLLPGFTPIHGLDWQDVLIPMSSDRALTPTRATVRRMTTDVLLGTAEFIELASELSDIGITVMQFHQLPRADVDYEDSQPHARVARYRLSGLTVSIDLPHAGEAALIAAIDPQDLTAAIARLTAG